MAANMSAANIHHIERDGAAPLMPGGPPLPNSFCGHSTDCIQMHDHDLAMLETEHQD